MTTPTTENYKTFCSSKGVELRLKPVSQFKLDALRASFQDIEPPTYFMDVLGEKRPHPMDEEIARNQGRLDEWNEYLRLKSAAAREQSKKVSELLIWEGIELDVPGPDSEWQRVSAAFGIVLSDDPIQRKAQYVYNEVLVGGEDVASLISQIMAVSQIDEEVVQKIRDSFRAQKKRNADLPVRQTKRKVGNK